MKSSVADSLLPQALLERLLPRPPKFVCCHLSLSGLRLGPAQARQVAAELLAYLGSECTLVVPCYPFGPNVEYEAYLGQDSVVYDRARTPCRVNIFGEVFRRRAGVLRSLHPIFPMAALGPGAEAVLAESHLDEMPFGPRTVFGQLERRETAVLGLGVDLNTNSMFHLVDDPFVERFPFPFYSHDLIDCHILDQGRPVDRRKYRYLLPSLRRRIRPGLLHARWLGEPFYRAVESDGPGPRGYSLLLGEFVARGRELAREALDRGEMPEWHRR